ncbi:MAG TPA: hypothetical protein VM285_16185, partial [Polyangia bacterium]|nr:hypothetical protein [Polyangia bacterium]
IAVDGTVTCEADDDTNTTYSASTGLTLTGVAFSADTTYLQRRVSTTCAAGSSIRAIAVDGTVTCEADDDTNTTYTAGTGLTLTGTAFSANTSVVQSRVSGTCGEGQAIRVVNAAGTVTCQQVAPPAPVKMTALNGGTTASVGLNWTQLNIGTKTFNKVYGSASTKVELTLNSIIYPGTFAGGATGIMLQMRVDGSQPNVAQDYWIRSSATTERVIFTNYFTNLGAGSHTVTLWALTNMGTSANVSQDSGGWGGAIIAKEY